MDHFSPVAPAHIGALVLPVGQIDGHRFHRILLRLQTEASIIPLRDVEQHTDSDGFSLSPKVFPSGSLLYRFSSAAPSEQHQQLSPFELFREPLLVIGVVDGLHSDEEKGRQELRDAAAYLKERHPRVVHRQLIALRKSEDAPTWDPAQAIGVANFENSNDPSLREAICETSGRFLVELTTYAKATHASPTIPTPGQTARGLQRTTSLREEERRPGTGRSTPPQVTSVSSPTDEGSPSRMASKVPPVPATSFDQMAALNSPPRNASRPESRASNIGKSGKRSSSQDRVSVQGFGSSTTQEKARMRGKARVGIVLGSIHMLAGQWGKALPILVEHTTKARGLQDHLWHAKGLESMMVCMMLLAWSGVDFQVPSICEPVTDRAGAAHAARVAAETKAAAEGTKQQLQLFRLSLAIPDLAKMIISLYRSPEGSLELPFVLVAEATIRMSKLLAMLSLAGGMFSAANLFSVVAGQGLNSAGGKGSNVAPAYSRAKLSKAGIADMLAQSLPTADDSVATANHMRILAGVASAYALLGLERKKAITLKELVVRLTGALIQARKLGAAEMGIHPAASLSTDTGVDAVLAIAEESRGINDLMIDVSQTYGASLASLSYSEDPLFLDTKAFGNSKLQVELLRELAGFCEASPDPFGVLLLTSSLLRVAGPNAALDVAPGPIHAKNAFSREEQMHLATVIHRTVTVSKHLGLVDAQATYWDPFLVRGIDVVQPNGDKAVIDRSKINIVDTSDEPIAPGNPLLYDPNASRPGTAAKQVFLLVQDEPSQCTVALQNPFDIPVDIEELELVTDGLELACYHEPVTLGPLRFQQVPIMVTPKSVGAVKITGCRIKMQGCFPQVFPIVERAWSAKSPLVIKSFGLNAQPAHSDAGKQYNLKGIGLDADTVSATVIDALPTLTLEKTSVLESGLMLLEGESKPLSLTLRNDGHTEASVFEIKDTGDVLRHDERFGPIFSRSGIAIRPGASVTFNFEVDGKAGVSSTQAAFYYGTGEPAVKYARVVTVPLAMTVNAALQVQNLEVFPGDDGDVLLVSLDVRNAWPKTISYNCAVEDAATSQQETGESGVLAPGEICRVQLSVPGTVAAGQFEETAEIAKEKFLGRVKVSWRMEDRTGALDLRSLTLPPESLALVRGAPVQLSVRLIAQQGDKSGNITVGSFITVRVELSKHSRCPSPLSVELRTPESVRDERRLAVVGTLKRLVPALVGGEPLVVDFVLCPLLAGQVSLETIVRPVAHLGDGGDGGWLSRRALSISVV